MSEEQVKVLYYAPLPEGRQHDAFRSRWREHGELAMSLPSWRHETRYVQFDALGADDHGLSAEQRAGTFNASYGGVGAIWFRSAEALHEAIEDPDAAVMQTDEVATFGRVLGGDLVPTREHVVLDRGPAAITVINQLHRQQGVSRERFSDQWRAMGDEVAATPELVRHLRSYVQDHALPGVEGWDGIVELGFDTVADFLAFMAEPRTSDWLMPHEAAFIDVGRGQPLVTRGTLLFDADGAA